MPYVGEPSRSLADELSQHVAPECSLPLALRIERAEVVK